MKFKNSIVFIILSVLFLFACKSSKKINTAVPLVIYKLETGACYGKCPIFLLEIDENGLAYLDAKKFNKIDGKLKRQLSPEEMDQLKKSYKKANLFSLQDSYPSNVADLPSIKISQLKDGKTKTVKASDKMPAGYEDLLKVLKSVVEKDGWILLEEYRHEEEIVESNEAYIYEEIIVSFKAGTRLPQWFKDNEANSIRLLKAIDPATNAWLITYDKSKFEPHFILDKLKKDANVVNAEFNKQTKER